MLDTPEETETWRFLPLFLCSQLGELLEAFSAQPCNLQPLSSDSDDNPVGDEGDDNDDDVSRGKGKGSSATRLSSKFDVDDVTHIITLSPTYWGHNLVRDYNQRILDEYESATSSGAPSSYTVNTSAPPLPSTAPTSDGKRGLLIAEVTVSVSALVVSSATCLQSCYHIS